MIHINYLYILYIYEKNLLPDLKAGGSETAQGDYLKKIRLYLPRVAHLGKI